MKRKAQAAGAAGLIGLILLFIILYILFLPPADRAALLDDSSSSGGSSTSSAHSNIYSENIGRIDYVKQRSFEKTLPTVFLQQRREAQVIKQFSSVYVKSGLFDTKDRELSFTVTNLDQLENAQLIFAAKTHKGILSVDLNGERIFESEVTSFNVDPISIDTAKIKAENTLRVSVSGVGMRFWATNEYALDDMKIVATILDKSGQKSESVFTLTATEFFNMEEATLRFVPYCGNQDVGVLDVTANSRNVFSAVPVCDDPVQVSLDPALLSKGVNKIGFATERGSYTIEQVKVSGKLKESSAVTRFFEMNDTYYKRVRDNKANVDLIITFVDDTERKQAELNVNGRLSQIDAKDKVYKRRITSSITEGNNYITLTPKSTLYIANMEIQVV